MKKQFFRVKQFADQTFSRAGKTEVLSEDLEGAERRIEYIKVTCQNTGKKVSSCLLLPGQGQGDWKEKVLKKSSEFQLGCAMLDSSHLCDEDSLLKSVLARSGGTLQELATEGAERDQQIDSLVVTPLQRLSDVDIPNIMKQKRNLAKLILDMDSAKTRFQQAQKHSASNTTTKTEAIKDEMEECESKVEQCRDALACDMFQLIAKEPDVSLNILQLCKLQRAYHESALYTLQRVIPELESSINSCSRKTVYGFSLEEHLRITGRKIAYPIELCVCALLEIGMVEEGLFRLTGGRTKLNRMKYSIDAWCMTLPTAISYKDPHVIAGALKSYLRELPEPLLTTELHEDWLSVARLQTSSDTKLQALWTVVQRLPQSNLDNLKYLVKFFNNLSKYQDYNKMTPQNIAIVIAPSMMLIQEDPSGMNNLNMNSVNLYSTIVDLLVTHADWFFPGEVEFYQTLEPNVQHEQPTAVYEEHRRSHTRNHSGDFIDMNTSTQEIKRSQSNNSLSEDSQQNCSPRPITRRKNKSAAPPVPPSPNIKKEDKPDKPPRPNATSQPVVNATTLPRQKSVKENKSTETDDPCVMSQSLGPTSFEAHLKPDNKADYVTSSIENINISYAKLKNGGDKEKVQPQQKVNMSTNTEAAPPVAAPRTTLERDEVKEELELANNTRHDMSSVKKEWLLGKMKEDKMKPDVPERPAMLKAQHSFRNNYENVSVSSNDSSSDEKLTLQKTQMYSIDKKQVSIVNYDEKRKRRNSSGSNTPRPMSLPGAEKPERPPKPDHISPTSGSSHSYGLLDGLTIDRVVDNTEDNNNHHPHPHQQPPQQQQVIKHPNTSPPPVPAKPRTQSVTDVLTGTDL